MRYFLLLLLAFCVARSSAQQTVAYYPFSTDGGDSSGNGYHAGLYYAAYASNGLHINNDSSEALIPKKVFNGRLHFSISCDVWFDSLQTLDSAARNSILFGATTVCGPVPLGIFYCKKSSQGQPANSWLLAFDNKPYIIPDANVQPGQWMHIDARKDSGYVRFYKNGTLMQSATDSSDSIHIVLNAQVGQFNGCLAPFWNKSLSGAVKNLRVMDLDIHTSAIQVTGHDALRIFPDPASDYFSCTGEGLRPLSCTISDLSGRTVMQVQGAERISVQSLPDGIYFLRVETASGFLRRELVVAH